MAEKKTVVRKRPTTVSKKDLEAKEALRGMAEAKRVIAEQQLVSKEHEAKLLKYLEDSEQTSITVSHGKDTLTGTRVQSEKVEIDDAALRKKVGSRTFERISTRVIDKSLLGEALKNNVVSEVDVASVSTVTPNSPYVRVTKK